MAASAPVVMSLLAACGGDDDDDDGGDSAEATETPARSVPTAAVGGQETATEDDEEAATEVEDAEETAEDEATEMATEEDEVEATESDEMDDEAKYGGTMIVTGHHEIASLSPDDAGPTVHYTIVSNMFNRMLELDPWYTLQPVLAESFEVSEDGTVYTFNLVEGVMFHNGDDMTATDVKYTIDWQADEANGTVQHNNFTSVASTEAVDDYTVTITLSQPSAPFLALGVNGLGGMVLPSAYHAEIGEDAFKAEAVGTGAFKLKQWNAAEFTEIEAFEDHFRGRPYLDIFRENIVPEASVRAVALETGEADSAVWPLVTEDHLRFLEDPQFEDYTVIVTSSVAVNHFPTDNLHPVLGDKMVRQAMMYAIDRESIANDLWSGLAVVATANLSPALEFYYNPDVVTYEYDPELAAQMLDEAGWVVGADGIREKDGVRAAWTCTIITGDQARRPEAEVVQQWFSEVGLEMTIAEAPTATILEEFENDNLDQSLFNWTYGGTSGDPDGSTGLRSDALRNFSNFRNDRVDELLDMGVAETDPDARAEIYKEIQAIVAEEVPFLFIKYWDWFNIYTPRIKGLPEDPLVAGAAENDYVINLWIEE